MVRHLWTVLTIRYAIDRYVRIMRVVVGINFLSVVGLYG